MTNLKNRSIAGLGAMIATVVSVAAATPLRAETVVPVSYADLDLHSVAGTQELNRRLHVASKRVCGDSEGAMAFAMCRQRAFSAAKAKLASVDTGVQLAAR